MNRREVGSILLYYIATDNSDRYTIWRSLLRLWRVIGSVVCVLGSGVNTVATVPPPACCTVGLNRSQEPITDTLGLNSIAGRRPPGAHRATRRESRDRRRSSGQGRPFRVVTRQRHKRLRNGRSRWRQGPGRLRRAAPARGQGGGCACREDRGLQPGSRHSIHFITNL